LTVDHDDIDLTSPPASPAPGGSPEHTLYGSGGEDKLTGQQGEQQAIIYLIYSNN